MGFIVGVSLFMLVAGPVASVLWFLFSWSKFKSCVPFTAEYEKKKRRLIVSAVVAGIMLAVFLTIMIIYGATVFFA